MSYGLLVRRDYLLIHASFSGGHSRFENSQHPHPRRRFFTTAPGDISANLLSKFFIQIFYPNFFLSKFFLSKFFIQIFYPNFLSKFFGAETGVKERAADLGLRLNLPARAFWAFARELCFSRVNHTRAPSRLLRFSSFTMSYDNRYSPLSGLHDNDLNIRVGGQGFKV